MGRRHQRLLRLWVSWVRVGLSLGQGVWRQCHLQRGLGQHRRRQVLVEHQGWQLLQMEDTIFLLYRPTSSSTLP
jgi:hypothetical protein